MYLFGELGSLLREIRLNLRRNLGKFLVVFLSNVNLLLLSTALKFEISIFFGMSKDFKVCHISFGFSIYSDSLSSKNCRSFAVINFNVLYFSFCSTPYQCGV